MTWAELPLTFFFISSEPIITCLQPEQYKQRRWRCQHDKNIYVNLKDWECKKHLYPAGASLSHSYVDIAGCQCVYGLDFLINFMENMNRHYCIRQGNYGCLFFCFFIFFF